MAFQRRSFGGRRSFAGRRSVRRVGRRTNRVKRLVDGHGVLSKAERMISTGASTAATVASLARNVGTIMSMINTEVKYNDVTDSGIFFDNTLATGTVVPLTLTTLGDTDNQRNGSQILGKDLSIKFTLDWNPDNITPITARVIVFCDKEYDGVVPTGTQLLEAPGNVLSAFNKDNTKRFAILKNATYDLFANTAQVHDKIYLKVPFHIFYDTSEGDVVDGKENQIFIAFMSDVITGGDLPTFSFYSRFNFYDN